MLQSRKLDKFPNSLRRNKTISKQKPIQGIKEKDNMCEGGNEVVPWPSGIPHLYYTHKKRVIQKGGLSKISRKHSNWKWSYGEKALRKKK